MKSVLFVTSLAWLVGAFGMFVLPRAVSTDLPEASPRASASVVLIASRPDDDWCPWKGRAAATVTLDGDV